MSRSSILARIRAATPASTAPLRPSNPAPASLVSSGDGAHLRFRRAAEAKGVTVVDVEDTESLPVAIARTLAATNAGTGPIRLNDPALADLPWHKANLEIARGAAEPHDRLTISAAVAAVAETGSLVLASGPGNPATLAFLPETHLVAVARATIVGTFEDAFALLQIRYGEGLPRAINLISGASRTGDIGGRIVQGAHGPRRLAVFIT